MDENPYKASEHKADAKPTGGWGWLAGLSVALAVLLIAALAVLGLWLYAEANDWFFRLSS